MPPPNFRLASQIQNPGYGPDSRQRAQASLLRRAARMNRKTGDSRTGAPAATTPTRVRLSESSAS